MLDLDAGKLLIVGVIALIFIPPKDLPRVLRQVGQMVGKMRRMANDFRGQLMDAMREADIADVRREAHELAEAARIDVGLDSLQDLDRQMVAHRPADLASERDQMMPLPPARAAETSGEPHPPSAPAPHSA